jgi:hypothetical protein
VVRTDELLDACPGAATEVEVHASPHDRSLEECRTTVSERVGRREQRETQESDEPPHDERTSGCGERIAERRPFQLGWRYSPAMGDVVEVRVGATVSEVVDRLAAGVGESTLSVPLAHRIADGEWVRFVVMLDDGTPVLEGTGRCDGSLPRGASLDRYDVTLSELSFDERNEIMFERILIARDAAEKGDDTGAMKLAAIEAIEEDVSARDEKVTASPLKKPSVPPPAPKAKPLPRRSTPPGKPASIPPKRKSRPPERAAEKPKAMPKLASARPSASVSDDAYTLPVDASLVARARDLEQRLPRRLLDRDRQPGKPEAAVLTVALRMGLAALGAVAEE